MSVTTEQIESAEGWVGRSVDHGFTPAERAEYDTLRASGRTLYDGLRTLYGTGHERAYCVALVRYGRKR